MNITFDADKLAGDVLQKRQSKSYDEIGAAVGIAPSTVYRAENGLALSIKSFTRICGWLGKEPGAYFKTETE